MTDRCLFCRKPADERHHPTGCCAPDGPHFDPDFTIPLCRSCHQAEHAAWRDGGLDDLSDPLEARVQRLSWLMVRLGTFGLSIEELPEVRSGIHTVLVACVAHFEQYEPAGVAR